MYLTANLTAAQRNAEYRYTDALDLVIAVNAAIRAFEASNGSSEILSNLYAERQYANDLARQAMLARRAAYAE